MQNNEWISLFRQLPQDIHNQIVLVLNNRTEISIEALFRIEPAYLLIRGRLGGTTDGGMPFVVPYDQLSAIYLYRQIKESEVEEVFGPPRSALAKSSNGTASKSQLSSPAPTVAAPPTAAAPSAVTAMPSFGRPTEATAVARNNLLERLRAARQAAMPPNGK